ncbi:HYR-like domain-containing protein, partial [Halocola ammonii]
TIQDTTAPVVEFAPADTTLECGVEIPQVAPVFSDNCTDSLQVNAASSIAQLDCGYVINRSWTAIDDCGNETTVNQTITVVDTTAPVLSATPANVTIECDEDIPSITITATDNCDENVLVNFTETTEELECGYRLLRTWSAADNCGNGVSHTQIITIEDTTAPVFTSVPAALTLECDAEIPATTAEAVDNCDSSVV